MGLEANHIYLGDCFELMKEIPDKSIDCILTDPPYNMKKGDWDKFKQKDYYQFMFSFFRECDRIVKDNGCFWFFHQYMQDISEFCVWLRNNTGFVFNSFVVWDKGEFRGDVWKSTGTGLRSFFQTCEYVLYFTRQDETGLTTVMLDVNNFSSLRKYFYELIQFIGLNCIPKKIIIEKIGQQADHCFRWGSSQWDLCTKETYQQLIDVFAIDKWEGFREYEDLRREYEDLRREYEDLRYTFNIFDRHNKNIWHFKNRKKTIHSCEKPLYIIRKMLKHTTREGQLVLDPFSGSGTTAVACKELKRQYIGIEKEEEYYKIAQRRIDEVNNLL